MIYLYRGLYIAGILCIMKVMTFLIDIKVAELAAYFAAVVIADQMSLQRLQRILQDEKERLEKMKNE